MNKKEKYINYVVDDLVKNTEIDHDQETIKFPFYYFSFLFHTHPFFSSLPALSYLIFFSKHVIERYGVHDEEMRIIWNQYREKILTIIGNG